MTHFENKHNNLASEANIKSSLLSIDSAINEEENVPEKLIMKTSSDNSKTAPTNGATSKRWHNIEQFLKSLMGKRSSQPPTSTANAVVASSVIQVNKSPSAYDFNEKSSGSTVSLNKDRLINKSTASLNSTSASLALVHQKLWSVMPLLTRRDGIREGSSCNNLLLSNESQSTPSYGKMRKCETVLVLTDERQHRKFYPLPSTSARSHAHSKSINNLLDPMPIRPLNRLRNSQSCYVNCDSNATRQNHQTCSQCSSLLSLAAIGGSSYSLKNGAFVPKNAKHLSKHTNKNSSLLHEEFLVSTEDCSNHNLIENDFNTIEPYDMPSDVIKNSMREQKGAFVKFTCKLCLGEYFNENKLTTIASCGCTFCTEVRVVY